MTKDEVRNILNILTSQYTREYIGLSQVQKDLLVTTWELSFKKVDYETVLKAVIEYINNPKKCAFPPKPGDIKGIIYDEMEKDEINELDAWNMAYKAIRGNAELARKEFNKLPLEVQKAVGDYSQLITWAMADISQISFIQQAFMKNFRKVKEAKKYEVVNQIATQVKVMIE